MKLVMVQLLQAKQTTSPRAQANGQCYNRALEQLKGGLDPIWAQVVLQIRFGLVETVENSIISPKFHPLD